MATTTGSLYRIEEKVLGTIAGQKVEVIKIRSIKDNDAFATVRYLTNPGTGIIPQ